MAIRIFDKSWQLGEVSGNLKKKKKGGNTAPIFKKGRKDNLRNY